MQKLVIASHNPGKVNEFKKFMADWPYEIVGLDDLGIIDNVEETGNTFAENALIKAKFFHELTDLPTLSDDDGFEIDALEGEPGVKSRRWKGYEMSDQEMIDYALEKLQNVPAEKRTARLKAVVCLILPNKDPIFAEAAIEGIITKRQEALIIKGYPFRSIMIIPKFNKLFAHLTDDEHKQLSHRLLALNKLKNQLK